MTSKERVYSALHFEKPDRVPRFVWLGGGTAQRLAANMGLAPHELDVALGNDVLQTWLSINGEMERSLPQGTEHVDEWGITWRRDGYYNMVVRHPLAGEDAAFIGDYALPDPLAPARFEKLDQLLHQCGQSHFIGADVSGSLFEPAYHLRGMEALMMDLAMESPEADVLLDRLEAFTTAVSLACVARGADWIWLGDDMGSQQGMLLSPDMWRLHFKPRMARIVQQIKAAKPGIFVAYHSCGSIRPIIGDLADIGIDVLNPIQESAKGMDQAEIKQSFGSRLTLMCGLDTQQFLVTATPEQVRQRTRDIARRLGYNGGFIFAASHHIQHDTPDENIAALFDTLDEG